MNKQRSGLLALAALVIVLFVGSTYTCVKLTRNQRVETIAAPVLTPRSSSTPVTINPTTPPRAPVAQAFGVVFYDLDNPTKYPLGDVRVRNALSLSINRREVIDKLYGGYVQPSALAMAFPSAYFWDSAQLKPDPYDPEGAGKLLAEAGYPSGFDIRIWDTGILEDTGGINIVVSQAMGGYWQKVGVKAEVVLIDPGAVAAMYQPKHVPRIWNSVYPVVSSPGAGQVENLGEYHSKKSSYKNIRNPKLDGLIDKVHMTTDVVEKRRLALEAAVMAKIEYALIPVLDMYTISGLGTR